MKTIFAFLFLIVSFITKAQDCYNGGIAITQREDAIANENAVPVHENALILMPYVMKEKTILQIMQEKNNAEINRLLKKLKRAENMRHAGFAAIPTGILGMMSLAGTKNADTGNSFRTAQIGTGVGLLALSSLCLGASYCFKLQHAKNYKKAIAKYNQLYN